MTSRETVSIVLVVVLTQPPLWSYWLKISPREAVPLKAPTGRGYPKARKEEYGKIRTFGRDILDKV